MAATTTTSAIAPVAPPAFVFPYNHDASPARHARKPFAARPLSSSAGASTEAKQRSPARSHAHRRSAAMSHDFMVELQSQHDLARQQKQAPKSTDMHVSRSMSPSPSSSVSRASSSASLASVSSTSTTPPAKAKVMFSPSVEFIPSHSVTTSTSTTATITPNHRLSAEVPEPPAEASPGPVTVVAPVPRSEPASPDKNNKKARSWSFMRFRWKSVLDQPSSKASGTASTIESDEEEEEEDDDNAEFLALARPATPPRVSHSSTPHYFTRSGTPEPMIDLDAALGPAGTPPLLSGSWQSSASYAGTHRRSESAPGLIAWDGTRSVDFHTFSMSMSRQLDGPPISNPRSRMKRKMSAVVEIEEAMENEEGGEALAAAIASERARQLQTHDESIEVPSEQRGRSVWDDFVNSFAKVAAEQSQDLTDSTSPERASSPGSTSTLPDEVLIVDEYGEAIILGEPGPEIRHILTNTTTATKTTTLAEADGHSLQNSCSHSTLSADVQSVESGRAGAFERELERLHSKKSHTRRRSLAFSLKSAMMRSKSAGNLASGCEENTAIARTLSSEISAASPKKGKVRRRHSSKSQSSIQTSGDEKFGRLSRGWKSLGNLTSPSSTFLPNEQSHAGTGPHRRNPSSSSRSTLSRRSIHSGGAYTATSGVHTVIHRRSFAGRMWNWISSAVS
ncbi:uncharacterized protein V1518DRAFT_393047 [Limtongia smithiae]|uniref:uncharacterized protein n=1 Tax=Limtongia smithiae TaxID=1125753 RepID=UPI0034CF08C6